MDKKNQYVDLVGLRAPLPHRSGWHLFWPFTQQYVVLDKLTLAKRILNNSDLISDFDLGDSFFSNDECLAAFHWYKRNWRISLDAYLASRYVHFADQNDCDGTVRASVLGSYLAERLPPPERQFSPEAVSIPLKTCNACYPMEIVDILMNRRTTRKFSNRAITEASLACILERGLRRIRNTRERAKKEKLGLLFSFGVAFEFYVAVFNVEDVEPGCYHVDISASRLVLVHRESMRSDFYEAIMRQPAVNTANFSVVMTAVWGQYQWRYRHERALRNLFIEAGRVAQYLIISAARHQCGTFVTPAIAESRMGRMLQIDNDLETALYTITIGQTSKNRHDPSSA